MRIKRVLFKWGDIAIRVAFLGLFVVAGLSLLLFYCSASFIANKLNN